MKVLVSEMENAFIGDVNHFTTKYVTLNSKVTYKDIKSGTISKATIVFPVFADSTKDLYSILSPLGTALIGEAVGNIATCYAPAGVIELEVIDVEQVTIGGE
ncbi:GreA/GreB family elongation factor [Thiospirochaeta perfilievii]|uniref:GreA/GreB family elongation factor n=1 Tax=Thiospirochaeta perfilievii TaxID=252967 RepID=A0A5C1QCG9_9SPIO|nr:GreA/GreB family elongation factor [Thiospirochaeta perfilievii]QEN05241.1 GreA/GreB family elongation factor [Thiospirochaeta perfilievii]